MDHRLRAVTMTAVAGLLAGLLLFSHGCGSDGGAGQTGGQNTQQQANASTSATQPARTVDPSQRVSLDPNPPADPVRLIFIHHSVGEDWLDDSKGGLGQALRDNNYYVSDTNYGWGPPDADAGSENIGDHTDIGQWYDWFAGPHSTTYLTALYAEGGQHTGSPYSRLPAASDPGGENEIIVFKSCFPNSALGGSPGDQPAPADANPLQGQPSGSDAMTVADAKGIYNDLLAYFATRPDKLFIVVTAPPLQASDTTPEQAANARAFNRWLAEDWLADYRYRNVAVFDFYDVLTSNGGSAETSDAGAATGNHHRYDSTIDAIDYTTNQGTDFAAYASGDSHPTAAGLTKATTEFIKLLNIDYHDWKES